MFIADTPAYYHPQHPMNYFFESFEDYAANGGVITGAVRDAYMDPCDLWAETYEASDSHEEEIEYREDKYEQMAARHGCWCILTARYIDSATYNLRDTQHITCAAYTQRTQHIACGRTGTQYMHSASAGARSI